MKKNYKYLILLVCSLFFVSCNGDDDTLVLEENGCVLLGDKYVEATTNFTDDRALDVLKSEIWYNDGHPYIYNNEQMVRVNRGGEHYWYSFKEGGIFKSSPYLNDIKEDKGPEFEFSVEMGTLTMRYVYRDVLGSIYSDYTRKYKLVAVDAERIIMDKAGIDCPVPNDFPIKDNGKATTRYVWKAVK